MKSGWQLTAFKNFSERSSWPWLVAVAFLGCAFLSTFVTPWGGGGGGGGEAGVWAYDRYLFHHPSEQTPRCGRRSFKLNSSPLLLPTLTTIHPVSSTQQHTSTLLGTWEGASESELGTSLSHPHSPSITKSVRPPPRLPTSALSPCPPPLPWSSLHQVPPRPLPWPPNALPPFLQPPTPFQHRAPMIFS